MRPVTRGGRGKTYGFKILLKYGFLKMSSGNTALEARATMNEGMCADFCVLRKDLLFLGKLDF